jgi:hypothetical protein
MTAAPGNYVTVDTRLRPIDCHAVDVAPEPALEPAGVA